LPPAEIVSLIWDTLRGRAYVRMVLQGERKRGSIRVDQIVLGTKTHSLWIDPDGAVS
jgi:hypothetical protein